MVMLKFDEILPEFRERSMISEHGKQHDDLQNLLPTFAKIESSNSLK